MADLEFDAERRRGAAFKSNKFWLIILCGIVVISAIAAHQIGQVQSSHAFVYQDGVLIETVNLAAITKTYLIVLIEDEDVGIINGGYNVVQVDSGQIRMVGANCPDMTCVLQGWKSGGITPIVCLPNRVIITFEGGGSGVDAVVG